MTGPRLVCGHTRESLFVQPAPSVCLAANHSADDACLQLGEARQSLTERLTGASHECRDPRSSLRRPGRPVGRSAHPCRVHPLAARGDTRVCHAHSRARGARNSDAHRGADESPAHANVDRASGVHRCRGLASGGVRGEHGWPGAHVAARSRWRVPRRPARWDGSHAHRRRPAGGRPPVATGEGCGGARGLGGGRVPGD